MAPQFIVTPIRLIVAVVRRMIQEIRKELIVITNMTGNNI
jgi:hypothetical protein